MKLGFCFLCQSDIHQLSLWENFFKNNYDQCNIYIHSYEPQNITQDFVRKYHIDKNIPTGWGDIYDVLKYIMNLSIQNNDTKFIVVSESTVPIKSFQYVYDYLTCNSKGFLKYTPHDSNDHKTLEKWNKIYMNHSKKFQHFQKNIDKKHWFYNETWIIFNQEMIQLILNDNEYIHYFKDIYVYDENYPIYLYSIKNKLHLFKNSKTTYTDWNTKTDHNGRRHPQTFTSIQPKLIHALKHPDLLFARKFTKTSDIGLYLPGIYNYFANNPSIFWEHDNEIFQQIYQHFHFASPKNTIFTYFSKMNIDDENKIIYRSMHKNFTRQVNNKLKMATVLDDETITPKVYTSSNDLLKHNYENDKIWFIKYIRGKCGEHVMCKTTDQLRSLEISPKFIIQEGIMDIDLHEGCKYTLRTFILIHNKQMYLYNKIKKRIHNKLYDEKTLDYFSQICGYPKSASTRILMNLDTKSDLNMKLKENLSKVKMKMHEVMHASDKYNYSLIGCDHLLRRNKEVILIEMNTFPDLVNSEEMNQTLNIPLMKDTINLIVNNEIHNYELIETL